MIKCKLDGKSIDQISEVLTKSLSSGKKVNSKDVLRLRLSVEEALGIWAKGLGEDSECICETGKRFGRNYLVLSVKGSKMDPSKAEGSELGLLEGPNILSAMGMIVHYEYSDGTNILKVYQPESKISKFLPTIICFCCPLIFGFTLKALRPDIAEGLFTYLVDPVFNKIMDLLGLIASPLIFLSLYSGVLGIGDKATFDKIGRFACVRFIARTFIILIVATAGLMLFFPFSMEGTGNVAAGLSSALVLLLDIIPADIISPFLNGNAMQIVFLAIVLGIASLALGEFVKDLSKVIEQLSLIVQRLMSVVGDMMTGFMVVSLLDVSLSGGGFDAGSLIKFVILIVVFCLVFILGYVLYVCIRHKFSIKKFFAAVIPSGVMAFTTASLPSVLGMNMDCVRKDLKVKNKFVNFCVPFGQIVFKPATGLCYILTALCLAEASDVAITPLFLLTCVLLSSVLAVATPPIPGGAIGSLSILFVQLGIPATAIALAINLTLLMDNTCATTNDICFIAETYDIAHALDMVEDKK